MRRHAGRCCGKESGIAAVSNPMNLKKKTIISNIFQYASAQYFSQFIGFFTAVFIRRFLGPVYMGIWSMLKVIMGYSTYTSLGVTSTVPYKLPILKGQGKTEEINALVSVVFNFVTVTTFLCSIGVVIYALFFGRSLSREIFIGLLALSVILISQRVYTYYMILLRAHRDFGVLSKSIIFDAIVNLGLILLVVSRFQLYGFYVIVIIMPVLNVLFIRRYVTYDLRFSFDFRGLVYYIKYGFPLFINGILYQILHSIDRIMIAAMLGLEQLGFYSIALMTESYGTGIAKNFIIVIQPHFLEDFGSNGMEKSSRHVIFYSQVTAYFMAILMSLFFICAPIFIQYALPAFIPGIGALKIFLLSIFFLTISPYSNNFLVALEKQAKLIPITALSILLNIALNYVLIKKGYGINGAAFATSISAFIAFCVVSVYALKHCESNLTVVKFFVKILFPLFYCFLCLVAEEHLIILQNFFLETVLRAAVFIFLAAPLVLYINKKTGVIRILWEILRDKLSQAKRPAGK
ncbi:MAG: polysaccharide biosynthesis C-terminal domain-containing protein [Candidatus Aureabacteria bacterium]|nr:polysaccharide biosynthesis C-terminal domain-containing protein [Candidatus Auribacterota bacterium]